MIALGSISELSSLASSLPAPFLSRADSFGSEKRRESFLAGRALLQMMLRRKGLADSLPHIATCPHGKPYFDERQGPFFNISHSGGIIAVALSDERTGIDLEQVKARHNLQGLEDRELNEDEMSFVKEDPALELERFTALWTLRECLVKVTGVGLAGLGGIRPVPSRGIARAEGCPEGIASCRLYEGLPGARFPMWLTAFSGAGEVPAPVWAAPDGFAPMAPAQAAIEFRINA